MTATRCGNLREVFPFTEKEVANQRKKAYLSKDKPCILKKLLEWRV